MTTRDRIHRWHSPTIFGLIALCFLLPFATVSCGSAETTFTGVQLATWTVPDGGLVEGDQLGALVEGKASILAAITLVLASLGLTLGMLGRRGGGWCASGGILALVAIAWQAFDFYGPEVTFLEGYTSMLLLFLWAAVLHAARAWKRRRRRRPAQQAAAHGPS